MLFAVINITRLRARHKLLLFDTLRCRQVQVPVEFIGQVVVLEAFVSPTSVGQTQGVDTGVTPGVNSANHAGATQGVGSRRGGAGGDFASRLDGLFALSRWVGLA